MAESREDGGRWNIGDGEDGEFAYVDYAQGGRAKEPENLVEQASDGTSTAGWKAMSTIRVDAFRGHHCPICLGSVADSAMIEACQHVYCRDCLFEWLKSSDRCPLCKAVVQRVLHDIKCPREYRVRVHDRRDNNGGRVGNADGPPPSSSGALAEERSRGGGDRRGGGVDMRGAAFRPMVYRRGLAAEPPEQKARRPKSLGQLGPWIAREVQAATAGGGHGATGGVGGIDTRLVVDVVEALLKENDVDSQRGYCAVKEQLQGFLFENTAPFLHELWCFRWSKARMPAYDRDVVYTPRELPRR